MKVSLLNKIKNKLDNNKKYVLLLIGIFVLALAIYLS
jgi:flagellar biosynthesis/type III secretory pathway M-ring protein FliF/YscJ